MQSVLRAKILMLTRTNSDNTSYSEATGKAENIDTPGDLVSRLHRVVCAIENCQPEWGSCQEEKRTQVKSKFQKGNRVGTRFAAEQGFQLHS